MNYRTKRHTSESGELDLVKQAQEGDEQAFAALLKEHQSMVMNFAHNVCRDRTKAEETLQDTFINVYQKLSQFDGRSKFSTWLYSIVTNNCLMKRRRRKLDTMMEEYDEVPDRNEGVSKQTSAWLADWEDTPSRKVLNKELGEHLDKAILKLPLDYRLVFVLRDLEEKSNEETAAILKISVEATKSRLRRARAFLRKQLLPYVME
ncbi:MAG TPA: RNA polymerase subunit sigma-70 [Bacteroidetes bacterium]|nr:RNA polymerase subunit sigma-70 [Bacteroidota bacterium]